MYVYKILYENHVCRKINNLNIMKEQCLNNSINKRNMRMEFRNHNFI